MAKLFQSLYRNIFLFFVLMLWFLCCSWCSICQSWHCCYGVFPWEEWVAWKSPHIFSCFPYPLTYLKFPFFCPSQRRNFHYERWGVLSSESLRIKPCACRKVPFRKQQMLHPGHAHIPAEPWKIPRQPIPLSHYITTLSFSTLFFPTSLCFDLFGLSWLTTGIENHFFISILNSNGQKVSLCFKWNITFDT